MNGIMSQFKETAKEIRKLDQKKQLLRAQFEESTNELAECFYCIMEAELNGEKHTSLTYVMCPELYAKELDGMGFIVRELRNCCNALYGYDISWQ